MNVVDARGCAVSGSTPAARVAFELAVERFLGWRTGADVAVAAALDEAPCFVMAHVLQAYLSLCSRDPQRVRSAQPVLARAAGLPANRRERLHIATVAAVLADDYESCEDAARRAAAARAARRARAPGRPRVRLRDRRFARHEGAPRRGAAGVVGRPAGLLGVLAMHAFALEETGDYGRAEAAARTALALDHADARAHHVMAHVFEMTRRPQDGLRWLREHVAAWADDSVVATHVWWHVALYHLTQDRIDGALALYDRRLAIGYGGEVADLIDATALLWRVRLLGGDGGTRWDDLAAAWAPRIDDAFCTFNDVHAMLSFVGAGQAAQARRLEDGLLRGQSLPTRHGLTTREIGLPACRALMAYGEGNDRLAVTLLASLPPIAHRIGGSHAQRDVLRLTMRQAVARSGRAAAASTAAA
jgi:tetratricopeptide (TPR) repeat protein